MSVNIIFEGVERSFAIRPPPTYDRAREEPYPLFISLPGGGNPNLPTVAAWAEDLATEGWFGCFPMGLTVGMNQWDSGHAPTPRRWHYPDDPPGDYLVKDAMPSPDVVFLDSLITFLLERYHLDPGRVYIQGVSQGGMMAYRLAAHLSHRLTAIAVIASSIGGQVNPAGPRISNAPGDNLTPSPVGVLHIHGTADVAVPIKGGQGNGKTQRVDLPMEYAIERWVQNNRAGVGTHSEPPPLIIPNVGTFPVEVWRHDASPGAPWAPVEVRIVTGAGHGLTAIATTSAALQPVAKQLRGWILDFLRPLGV